MNAPTCPLWRPANNGTGARMWFIYRDAEEVHDRYGWDARGYLRRFSSHKSALRAAKLANAAKGDAS